jgi:hypothetical protein
VLEHGRQRPVAAQPRLQGGQGIPLPDGAGLAAGRPRLDHGQQLLRLLGHHPGLHQAPAGGREELADQLGRRERARPAARVKRPGQLGPQAELGGPVEVVVGLLEGKSTNHGAGVCGQGQGEAEQNAALASMSTTVGPEGRARSSMRRCPPPAGS